MLVAALAALIVRIRLRMPMRMAARAATDADRIFVYGSAAYTLLKLMKYKPAPGETPLLFARRLDRQKALPAQVLPLWRMMAMSHYSRVEPGPAEAARARDAFLRLYKPQSPLRKLRFMFAAAFGKGCYTSLDTPLVHEEPKPQYDYAAKVAQKKGKKHGKKPAGQKAPKAAAPKKKKAAAPKKKEAPPSAPPRPPQAGKRGLDAPRRRRSDRH